MGESKASKGLPIKLVLEQLERFLFLFLERLYPLISVHMGRIVIFLIDNHNHAIPWHLPAAQDF